MVCVLLRRGSLPRSGDGPQRILRLSPRRGLPSGEPLANMLLLLWCEHFENLGVLLPLVAGEECIRGLRVQLPVVGHDSQARFCVLTYLLNLRLLVVRERQS